MFLCVSVCVQQLWRIITTSTLQSDGPLHLHHLTVVSVCVLFLKMSDLTLEMATILTEPDILKPDEFELF